jgi:hypothetical protein
MQDVAVIDADGHVLETDAELEQYFDGPYKGHKRSGVFSIFPSLDGWPRGFVRGLDKVNRATADVWIEFIEGSKIDAAVLYPTAGLSFGLIQDPDWACAVARTYNNWLHDKYCRVDSRLKGVALLPVHHPMNAKRENSPRTFRSSGNETICRKAQREKSSAKTLSGFTIWFKQPNSRRYRELTG